MTGIEAFLEVLARSGVRHLFGNPGTTELPLNDALRRDARFRYLFGLHEIPVMGMADGYAQATGGVGVVNLHTACGLGNAMGMLYNAHVAGTPLIVTAGQQDRRLRFDEPVLEGDLVSVARPWTKWAAEINRVDDIPSAVRRAIQTALTPPTGPVFLSLPLDVQMESAGQLDLRPATIPDRRMCPSREGLRRASQILLDAKNPAILAGSRVLEAGATEELAALADALGAPVFAENTTTHGRMPIRSDHPLYQGVLPYWSPEVEATLKEFDVIFVVGMNLLRLYIYKDPARPIAESTRIVHLDCNAWEVGKNYPVEVGLIGDPKTGLAELGAMVGERTPVAYAPGSPGGKRRSERIGIWTERKRRSIDRLKEQLATIGATHESKGAMSSWTMMAQLAEVLPANVAVVEEAITSHHNVLEQLGVIRDPAAQFAHRGWALGWGMGCALGVQLAWPDRPVVALIGDGSAMYGIQALWSAAHHRIPVVYVICNNREYRILKVCGEQLNLPDLKGTPGLDLDGPSVDFVGLANAFGVAGVRVTEPGALREELQRGLAAREPRLLEVVISD